jgi:trehalose/maltose hydrolase-like predicted phosphorylase
MEVAARMRGNATMRAGSVRSRSHSPAPSPLPVELRRRFEALVFDWDGAVVADRTADARRVRALIEELCALGLDVFVVSGTDVDNVDGRLLARPQGPGRLHLCLNNGSEVFRVTRSGPKLVERQHVEIGLTDKSDSARWIEEDLRRRGITGALILVVGDEMGPLGGLPGSGSRILVPELGRAVAVSVGAEPAGVPGGVVALGGGRDSFLGLLEGQAQLRREGAVPCVDEDPAWTLAVSGFDPELERVHESLLTLGDGLIGTNGSPLASHEAARPEVLAAGLYDGEKKPETQLLACPLWERLPLALGDGAGLRRVLDLRGGLLEEVWGAPGGPSYRSLRFSSLSRPGTVAMRVEGEASSPLGPPRSPLVAPEGASGVRARANGATGRGSIRVRGPYGGAVSAAAIERRTDGRLPGWCLERLGTYEVDRREAPGRSEAQRRLRRAERVGFDHLLAEHRSAWAGRWERADVRIEGDPELQQAIRFGLFHLMSSVASDGEAAVGARGLSGRAYQGHVFWDSEVFVFPFLAATHPASARAMLEYRIRRLPAAMAAAKAAGCRGARFPWESASSGRDVTPTSARDRAGEIVPIRTGQLEEHIVADVAWAAVQYAEWTGDEAFLAGPARDLLVETARYWASRVRFDGEGRAHIYGVIGPDEYHESVDDNAFTNVMARWNLRQAARVVAAHPGDVGEFESLRWIETADALVDCMDRRTGLYEQFAGFYRLEPLIVSELSPRPVAADLLLGRERVQGAQVIKQPDVLMLHHMVPGEVAPGSLPVNLDFYEPRTAHGSSLSPGVCAALFARAGRLSDAVESLRLASRIDLDDLTGSSAGGLHLAAMGGVWQAMVLGFAGIRPSEGVLSIDPRLPSEWKALEVRVEFRGSHLRVHLEPGWVSVRADRPVAVRVGATGKKRRVGASELRVALPQEGR